MNLEKCWCVHAGGRGYLTFETPREQNYATPN